jgi:Tol biopolymer transport system component
LIGSVPTLAWSPDSSRLAFAHGVDDRAGLWIVSAASGAVRQVPMPPAIRPFSIVQPSWSPDGRRLAFVAQSGSLHTLSQIWSVNQDGTDPIAITDSSNANMHPAWLAGTLFFLSDRAGTLDVYEQPISRYGRRLGDPPDRERCGRGRAAARERARAEQSRAHPETTQKRSPRHTARRRCVTNRVC